MPVDIDNLADFPIDPEDSLNVFEAMKNAITRTQMQVADNYAPHGRTVRYPWVAPRFIRVVTYTGLGASWYGGRIQKRKTAGLDPTSDLDASTLWQDMRTTDDCYVVDLSANKLPASTHLSCLDSTIYVWGTFIDYSIARAANSSTNAPQVKRLPVFQTMGMVLVPVLVKITGSASRAGVYTARIWKVNGLTAMDTTGGSNLANTDFGTDPGSDNAYAFNTREVGTAGHALSTSSTPNLIPGVIVGRAAADSKVCVFVDECQ